MRQREDFFQDAPKGGDGVLPAWQAKRLLTGSGGHPAALSRIVEQEIQGLRERSDITRRHQKSSFSADQLGYGSYVTPDDRQAVCERFGVDDAVALVSGGQGEEVGGSVSGPERRIIDRPAYGNRRATYIRYSSVHGCPVDGTSIRLTDKLQRGSRPFVSRPRSHEIQDPLA